jgi:hypothetical protein
MAMAPPENQDVDEFGNLRVEAPGVMPRLTQPPYRQIPPDTVGRSQIQYAPTEADIPSMSMPAQEALGMKYGEYPVFKPGFGNRLIASMAGGSEGYFRGAGEGLKTGQAYLQAPWQEKLQTWQSQAAPLMYKAGAESQNFKNALERAKLQGEIGLGNMKNIVDVSNANTNIERSDTARYNAQTATQQANARTFGLGQPNYGFKETGEANNEFVGFDPKTGTTIRTGIKGQPRFRDIEELKKLMKYKYEEFGKMLRDLPQRDVFGALDNTLRIEASKYPAIYGKFMGKDGFLLPPSELKKFSGEDLETLRRFLDLGVTKSKEALTKSKKLGGPGLLNPIQTRPLPGGSVLLNPDEGGEDAVPTTDTEEEQ